MSEDIFTSLVEDGGLDFLKVLKVLGHDVTDALVAVHTSGEYDIVTLIAETAANILDGVVSKDLTKAERIEKAKTLQGYLDVIIRILEEEVEEGDVVPAEVNTATVVYHG